MFQLISIHKELIYSDEKEHVIYGEVACVAWRFWLGALSNKGGRGQRNREEIGAEANFAATPVLHPARQNRHATQANGEATLGRKREAVFLHMSNIKKC